MTEVDAINEEFYKNNKDTIDNNVNELWNKLLNDGEFAVSLHPLEYRIVRKIGEILQNRGATIELKSRDTLVGKI